MKVHATAMKLLYLKACLSNKRNNSRLHWNKHVKIDGNLKDITFELNNSIRSKRFLNSEIKSMKSVKIDKNK